ncbi:MAG: hypothetical protein HQL53_04505 [Magnetococcales bacterium]|nr:hypothetical protein [Magnetococcales bacterium]
MQTKIRNLIQEAKNERLEFAVPLIKSLQMSVLGSSGRKRGAPAGSLTVDDWLTLITNWEQQLGAVRPRQVEYGIQFFKEAMEKDDVPYSSFSSVLQVLVDMMQRLTNINKANQNDASQATSMAA